MNLFGLVAVYAPAGELAFASFAAAVIAGTIIATVQIIMGKAS